MDTTFTISLALLWRDIAEMSNGIAIQSNDFPITVNTTAMMVNGCKDRDCLYRKPIESVLDRFLTDGMMFSLRVSLSGLRAIGS